MSAVLEGELGDNSGGVLVSDVYAAERRPRHLVTTRKLRGGTRSAAGTATKMTLATRFGPWRLQERNPLTECRTLLAQPQL